jgi:hypothetical protein
MYTCGLDHTPVFFLTQIREQLIVLLDIYAVNNVVMAPALMDGNFYHCDVSDIIRRTFDFVFKAFRPFSWSSPFGAGSKVGFCLSRTGPSGTGGQ